MLERENAVLGIARGVMHSKSIERNRMKTLQRGGGNNDGHGVPVFATFRRHGYRLDVDGIRGLFSARNRDPLREGFRFFLRISNKRIECKFAAIAIRAPRDAKVARVKADSQNVRVVQL